MSTCFPAQRLSAGRLFIPQGDYAFLQCLRGRRPVVWKNRLAMQAIVENPDPATGILRDVGMGPRCPRRRGAVFLNVCIDMLFVETPYRAHAAFAQRLARASTGRLLMVGVGAGSDTPSVIRWPGERIVAQLPQAMLVRINCDNSEVTAALRPRAVGIGGDADRIDAAIGRRLRSPPMVAGGGLAV